MRCAAEVVSQSDVLRHPQDDPMRVRRAQVKKSEDTISAPSDELLSVLAKVRDARASREHSARTAEDLATGLQKLSRLTAELRTAIEGLPSMDMAKVVDLHNRLENGKFEIDSSKLAGKMLDFDRRDEPKK
jgi:flagellar biosynthesis anti-sigma factor FlgM